LRLRARGEKVVIYASMGQVLKDTITARVAHRLLGLGGLPYPAAEGMLAKAALLKGGANAQTAHLPVERAELTADAVAVRPGRGKLYVSLHDMYDAEKVGTIPGIEITLR
jgi:hypothetical protein